jgi:hypothetical protein
MFEFISSNLYSNFKRVKTKKKVKQSDASNDIHQDLKDFKETQSSMKALFEVKKSKKTKGASEEGEIEEKELEGKAFNALDKLFKEKSA